VTHISPQLGLAHHRIPNVLGLARRFSRNGVQSETGFNGPLLDLFFR
jgi:hypothetical protein